MMVQDDGDEVGRPAVDPILVSQYHLRREDDEIRDANMPERLFVEMQNDVIPQFHADDAANYIMSALFGEDSTHIAKVRLCHLGERVMKCIKYNSEKDKL
jgi:hypothetical protein